MAVRTRRIPIAAGNVPVNLGASTDQDLPRNFIYRGFILTISGTLTVTGANNTAANTVMGDVWNALQNIQFQFNGTPTWRNFDGPTLWWINRLLLENNFCPTPPPLIGDGATANPTFEAQLYVPTWLPGLWEQFQFALPANLLNSFQVRFTYGQATNINALATGLSLSLRMEADVQLDAMVGADGKPINYNPTLWFPVQQNVAVGAATNGFRLPMPTSNSYRGILVRCRNAGGTAESALLSALRLKTTGDVYYDRSGSSVRQETNCYYNRAVATPRSAGSSINGWYWMDLLTEREQAYVSEALPTTLKAPNGSLNKLSDLWIEVDTSAACILDAYAFQLVTP